MIINYEFTSSEYEKIYLGHILFGFTYLIFDIYMYYDLWISKVERQIDNHFINLPFHFPLSALEILKHKGKLIINLSIYLFAFQCGKRKGKLINQLSIYLFGIQKLYLGDIFFGFWYLIFGIYMY